MSTSQTILTLKGLTQKGKQRIKRDGTEWRVRDDIRENHNPIPKNLLIQSVLNPNQMRWIKPQNDPNFEIVSKTT